jgi:hypothetical protein
LAGAFPHARVLLHPCNAVAVCPANPVELHPALVAQGVLFGLPNSAHHKDVAPPNPLCGVFPRGEMPTPLGSSARLLFVRPDPTPVVVLVRACLLGSSPT